MSITKGSQKSNFAPGSTWGQQQTKHEGDRKYNTLEKSNCCISAQWTRISQKLSAPIKEQILFCSSCSRQHVPPASHICYVALIVCSNVKLIFVVASFWSLFPSEGKFRDHFFWWGSLYAGSRSVLSDQWWPTRTTHKHISRWLGLLHNFAYPDLWRCYSQMRFPLNMG